MKEARNYRHGAVTDDDWKAIVDSIRRSAEMILRPRYDGSTLFVELGTLGGNTTVGIRDILRDERVARPNIVTIDKDPKCARVLRNFRETESVRFFCGTSVDWLEQEGEGIAWAFIDGCHCEQCVIDDIKVFAPLLVPGGELCFHDAGNQRELGMKVHRRYHNDGKDRFYGVSEAISSSSHLTDFDRIQVVKPRPRPEGPTPVFGGVQIWRKRT